VLHAAATSRRALLARGELTLSFPAAIVAIAAAGLLASAASYRTLLPLTSSESPDALLVAFPIAALVLLAVRLAGQGRQGHELGINLVFAAPLALAYVLLLVWLPSRFANVYWVYRLDMLALPIIVAIATLLVFGLPALLRCSPAFLFFVVGWLPIFDRLVGLVAEPLAWLDTLAVRGLTAPLGGRVPWRDGSFVAAHGERLSISSACAGMTAVLSMVLVGTLALVALRGTTRARLTWLGAGIALVLAVNVARLVAVVCVARWRGTGAAFSVFHASAGELLFAGSFLALLLLAPRFGLTVALPSLRDARPVQLPRAKLAVVAALVATLAGLGAWTESGMGFPGPGSFRGTPSLRGDDLLPAVAGLRVEARERLRFVETLFGHGARAYEVQYGFGRSNGIGAQVVVVPSLTQVASYGALDCFLFHDYHVYSAHRRPLRNGGTAWLAALEIGRRDVASISWYQPVRVDGQNRWRRVILYQYLTGRPVRDDFRPSLSRRVGTWLLNTLAPFGRTTPPDRFRATERELLAVANALSVRSSS